MVTNTVPYLYPEDRLTRIEGEQRRLMAENEELKNLTAYLADELGSDVVGRAERDRHSRIVEAIMVESYGLHSAEAMYWKEERNLTGVLSKRNDRVSFVNRNKYVHRTAQVLLYYLLTQHCASVSLRWLEEHYGYARCHVGSSLARLYNKPEFVALAMPAERKYLDQIGRFDEPTTLYHEHCLRDAAALKQLCKKRGIDYRRSLTLLD